MAPTLNARARNAIGDITNSDEERLFRQGWLLIATFVLGAVFAVSVVSAMFTSPDTTEEAAAPFTTSQVGFGGGSGSTSTPTPTLVPTTAPAPTGCDHAGAAIAAAAVARAQLSGDWSSVGIAGGAAAPAAPASPVPASSVTVVGTTPGTTCGQVSVTVSFPSNGAFTSLTLTIQVFDDAGAWVFLPAGG
ncbi:MAG: hypothetical protein GY901_00070 [Actinomycetia bacterium]|nr:hypothetical protein [Actinomycetes bacterium]